MAQPEPDLHAPVYRFYPTEEELISFYLVNKLQNHSTRDFHRVIPVVNVYEHNPTHLPKLAGELCLRDTEQWFFFVPRQEREAQGGRPSRTTASGYWKATGSPTYVYSSDNKVIGVKKTMVFYEGKSRRVKKTIWKMNEYRAIKEEFDGSNAFPVPKLRHELSLCRVYVVSGTTRAFDRRPFGIEPTRENVNSKASTGASSSGIHHINVQATSTSNCLFPQQDCQHFG
ncbi:hypothetical protein QVD17_11415 [Tagetes erecta]|uniref:NAC domain-containing protein n=1 Tax=Tagetes erecta TaxID=13708 RepID=A0AAD8NUW3_TARER|nr:hypothetical protein QVD17_11415 [Tagetes erecta]